MFVVPKEFTIKLSEREQSLLEFWYNEVHNDKVRELVLAACNVENTDQNEIQKAQYIEKDIEICLKLTSSGVQVLAKAFEQEMILPEYTLEIVDKNGNQTTENISLYKDR